MVHRIFEKARPWKRHFYRFGQTRIFTKSRKFQNTHVSLSKYFSYRDIICLLFSSPENVPRLYDLVCVQDETVRTAFYYALRDTLIAEDLEQASRIAYGAQRFRVVTVGGDLIETTGKFLHSKIE